jgi:cell division septation protein DedD
MAALEKEVRSGSGVRRAKPRRGGRSPLSMILTGGAVVAAVAAAWIIFVLPGPPRPNERDARTAGDETVLPAPETTATTPLATRSGATGLEAPTPPPAGAPPIQANLAAGAAGSAAPLTTAPPAEGKKYMVHVASFRSEEKVAGMVRALRLKGLDAWYERVPDESGWYRVFVGRFATEDEANAYASWLLQNKWVDRAHAYIPTTR